MSARDNRRRKVRARCRLARWHGSRFRWTVHETVVAEFYDMSVLEAMQHGLIAERGSGCAFSRKKGTYE